MVTRQRLVVRGSSSYPKLWAKNTQYEDQANLTKDCAQFLADCKVVTIMLLTNILSPLITMNMKMIVNRDTSSLRTPYVAI